MSTRTRIVRLVAIMTCALLSVTAAANFGGVRVGSSRVAAKIPMQTQVTGRVTTQAGTSLRTHHTMASQSRALQTIITRAKVKDPLGPLVTHRKNLAELRNTGLGSPRLTTLRGSNHDLVLRVEKGMTAQKSFIDVPPEVSGMMQRSAYLPSGLGLKNGGWTVDIAGKAVPLRSPMIRRTGAAAAI